MSEPTSTASPAAAAAPSLLPVMQPPPGGVDTLPVMQVPAHLQAAPPAAAAPAAAPVFDAAAMQRMMEAQQQQIAALQAQLASAHVGGGGGGGGGYAQQAPPPPQQQPQQQWQQQQQQPPQQQQWQAPQQQQQPPQPQWQAPPQQATSAAPQYVQPQLTDRERELLAMEYQQQKRTAVEQSERDEAKERERERVRMANQWETMKLAQQGHIVVSAATAQVPTFAPAPGTGYAAVPAGGYAPAPPQAPFAPPPGGVGSQDALRVQLALQQQQIDDAARARVPGAAGLPTYAMPGQPQPQYAPQPQQYAPQPQQYAPQSQPQQQQQQQQQQYGYPPQQPPPQQQQQQYQPAPVQLYAPAPAPMAMAPSNTPMMHPQYLPGYQPMPPPLASSLPGPLMRHLDVRWFLYAADALLGDVAAAERRAGFVNVALLLQLERLVRDAHMGVVNMQQTVAANLAASGVARDDRDAYIPGAYPSGAPPYYFYTVSAAHVEHTGLDPRRFELVGRAAQYLLVFLESLSSDPNARAYCSPALAASVNVRRQLLLVVAMLDDLRPAIAQQHLIKAGTKESCCVM